jgi:hypothetical protein
MRDESMDSNELRTLLIYKDMMKEVRQRLDTIEALVNKETSLRARFARELSYLQLRMICEIIALGCIISHEGFSELSARKFRNSYAADEIVNFLSKLHDRFYPQPIKVERKQSGRISVEDNEIEHLSKENLKTLYRKCGAVLHRGTPATIISGEKIETDWIAYVMRQSQLAVNLLASHALVLHGDQRAIFCNFITGEAWVGNAR